MIEMLRDHRRKKLHHWIDLGGTSAHDHDHNGQFGEHRKLAMLRNRQLQGKPNTDEVFTDNLSEFENSAVVEVGNGDKLRDHRRKKQHHRIDLGGTSAHDSDHSVKFGEHRKPAMLKNRQLQGEPNTD